MDRYRFRCIVHYGLALLALGILGLALTGAPLSLSPPLLAVSSAVLVALLANFTVRFSRGDGNLVHPVAIALGLALGAGPAGLILLVGLLAGNLIRSFWPRSPAFRRVARAERWSVIAFEWGHQGLSVFASLGAYRLLGGRASPSGPGPMSALVVSLLTFYLIHVLIFLGDLALQGEPLRQFLRQNLRVYVAYELLPLLHGALASTVLLALGQETFLILGSITLAIAIVVHILSKVRTDLEQRVRELTTLNRVSRAMRTSLELDALLDTIYLQVAHVLGVRNMYVALYNLDTDTVSYPLTIRGGKRIEWAARRKATRLTDWVINTRSPLLIPYDVGAALKRMGMEEGSSVPEAWLGVPLLAADRALGCLAVYAIEPGETFTQEDLALLTTLGTQASVAVENAQLHGETRRRAAELATLNEISALMSATLDPERVLELVCSSVIQVVGGQKSAVFLRDPDRNELWLARAEGMSQEFMQASLTLPIDDRERVKAVTSGTAQIVSDVLRHPETTQVIRRLADTEGFRAYAELPLQAQGSIIGFLAVYFAEPHHFSTAEVDLLNTFASQAALAVSNARLYASTDQALAQRAEQLSTLEAIARELTATLNLQRLFDLILARAMDSTLAEAGSLVLYDASDDTIRIVASRGYTDSADTYLGQSLPASSGITGRAIRKGVPVYVPDVSADPDYRNLTGSSRSQLSVPIVREGQSLGVITLESPDLAAFSSDDEQFIAQLAAQAAIAIDNAHLYQEVQDRLHEQSILYEAGANLASTLEAQTVLNTVTRGLAQVLSAAGVAIFDWDAEADVITTVARFQRGEMVSEDIGQSLDLAHYPETRRVLEERQPIALRVDDPQGRELLKKPGYAANLPATRALLAMPMVAADRVVGLIEIYDENPRTFPQNEVQLAQTLANQGAIAVENARLFQRVTEGRDRLAAVLNSTREGVLMIDAGGRIALANPRIEAFFEVPRDRLEGQLLTELLSTPDIPIAEWLGYTPDEMLTLMSQLSEGLSPATHTVDYRIEPSRPRFLQRSGSPVRDDVGRVIGWVMVLRDITEEKELEEAREDLTSMIVHDLRSPLTAVLGANNLINDILDEEGVRNSVIQQAMEVSIRSCKKLLNLVNSMLDISRLERGEVLLNRQAVRLHKIVEDVVIDLAPLATEQGIILINNVPPEIGEVRVDEEKIGRVFTNLIDNSLKFTPPGGQVRVDCLPDGQDSVICQVLDTGPGIPDEYRDRVFDRFVQIQGRRGRRKGSGMGLAFVKLAVEAHGGRVWVENRPEGGSRFSFTLPVPGSPADLALEDKFASRSSG